MDYTASPGSLIAYLSSTSETNLSRLSVTKLRKRSITQQRKRPTSSPHNSAGAPSQRTAISASQKAARVPSHPHSISVGRSSRTADRWRSSRYPAIARGRRSGYLPPAGRDADSENSYITQPAAGLASTEHTKPGPPAQTGRSESGARRSEALSGNGPHTRKAVPTHNKPSIPNSVPLRLQPRSTAPQPLNGHWKPRLRASQCSHLAVYQKSSVISAGWRRGGNDYSTTPHVKISADLFTDKSPSHKQPCRKQIPYTLSWSPSTTINRPSKADRTHRMTDSLSISAAGHQ